MRQRFTARARDVIGLAQAEAARSGWNPVGTEHLLLGLLKQEDNVAAAILLRMHIDVPALRAETLRYITPGEGFDPLAEMKWVRFI